MLFDKYVNKRFEGILDKMSRIKENKNKNKKNKKIFLVQNLK